MSETPMRTVSDMKTIFSTCRTDAGWPGVKNGPAELTIKVSWD
jgi:hypothetical protein